MNITKNFTLEEMLSSATADKYGIKNVPTAEEQRHIVELVTKILLPLREAYGKPIIVTSGFRCKALNAKVNGSKTSAHISGYAADTKANNMKEYQEFAVKWIKEHCLFDQILHEYPHNGIDSWLHIGIRNLNGLLRKQVLTIK